MEPLIVAIDGPSGVGKTTASKLVARALDVPHIDTGAMYRAIALAAKRADVAQDNEAELERLASDATIEFRGTADNPRVILNGEDISDLIRTPEMSMGASNVSKLGAVRRVLVRLQQEMGKKAGGVLEGRDIGTKVFPSTPYKFFLNARPEVRAGRRYRELVAKGSTESLENVLSDTRKRDAQDSGRAESPLMWDDTYQLIDTSDLPIEEVVARIVAAVRESRAIP